MKKMFSIIMSLILSMCCMPITTLAMTNDVELDGVYVYDATLGKNVFLSVEDMTDTLPNVTSDELYAYEVYIDNVLDYELQVDLANDCATMYYNNGEKQEIIISEHVVVTKATDIVTRIVDEVSIMDYALAATDYIDNETLEITSTGAQKSLGTTVYDGYETMGCRIYSNPVESGYLQRKNSGYTTFDSYNFTISAGTAVGTAAGIICAIVTSGGSTVAVGVVTSLLCSLLGITVDGVIDYVVNGTFRCREYRWDYRVRRGSNAGTILLSEYKCRYWWEMYDNSGNRSFEPRTDIRDGWLLSNSDMIAYALGRM